MSMSLAEAEQAFLARDRCDRAALIHRGPQSLDTEDVRVDQDKVDAAWRGELRRRIDVIGAAKSNY